MAKISEIELKRIIPKTTNLKKVIPITDSSVVLLKLNHRRQK